MLTNIVTIPAGGVNGRSEKNAAAAPSVPFETARFLGALFAPTDLVLIRLIETHDAPDGRRLPGRTVCSKWFPAEHYASNGRAWNNLATLSAEQHANIFFGVAPRFSSPQGRDKASFDDAAQIRTMRALWADLDHCTVEEAKSRCEAAGLPAPSIVVQSGHGVHLYWLLDAPFVIDDAGAPLAIHPEWIDGGKDGKKRTKKQFVRGPQGQRIYKREAGYPIPSDKAERFKRILAGVAKVIHGDHTIDLARLMRLPGTMNRKNERNGAEPRPCVLVECDPGRRFPIEQFERFEVKQEVLPQRPERLPAGAYGGASRPALDSDADLIDKARSCQHGDKFDALWRGQRSANKTHSQDDWALCKSLAFWTGRDAARTASLFRQSGLYRPEGKAADYPENTARKACEAQKRSYGDGSYDPFHGEFANLPREIIDVPLPPRDGGVALARVNRFDDFGRFEVAPGSPGHPDYSPDYLEEENAAEAIREARADRSRNACSCPRGFIFDEAESDVFSDNAVVLIAVRCMHCSGCRAYLNERDLICASWHFKQATRAGQTLYILECTAEEWPAIYMRVYRSRGEYQLFPSGNGHVLITNADLAYSTPIADDAALDLVKTLLELHHREGSAVQRSHGWRLPDLKVKNSRLKNPIETIDPPTSEVAEQMAEVADADLKESTPKDTSWTQKYWRFSRPKGFSREERKQLRDNLRFGFVTDLEAFSEASESQFADNSAVSSVADDLSLSQTEAGP